MAVDALYTLAYARNGGAVRRYHTHTVLVPETVAAHSHGVAILCYLLSDRKPSANLLMAALTHDLAEGVVGDIPSPVKRNPEIRQVITQMEAAQDDEAGLLPDITSDEYRILKLADALDGMLYCIRERAMGNRLMSDVYRTYKSYVDKLLWTGGQHQIIGYINGLWSKYESK